MPDKKGKYGKVEDVLAAICVDEEYKVAAQNQERENRDFEGAVDLIELQGGEEEYDWHSNYHLPDYLSIFLTQMSGDAAQYFQSRDYVEVFLEDGSQDARGKAASVKECINRTLNQRHLQHFQKTIRAQGIRRLNRNVTLRCWWERRDAPAVTGFKARLEPDEFGGLKEVKEAQIEPMPVVDRFNYDVLDPRNTFASPEYAYTLQDKRYVYILGEATLDDLKRDEDLYGYFNLDKLEKIDPPKETQASENSSNKDDQADIPAGTRKKSNKPFDILYGFKKDWVTVTRRDELTGEPLEAEPGYDEYGNVKEKAEFEEIACAFALSGSSKVLIQYHLTPYVDVTGRPYRPLVRGLCFIHPTKDGGLGEGKMARELQGAMDDTFNISNDRVLLATMPVLKGNVYSLDDDNDTVEFAPNNIIKLHDTAHLEEFKIRDDIQGAMLQRGTLQRGLQQSLATYSPQMGETPGLASTTATAVADAATHATTRGNYSSLTAEYTMWCELYWMILQMTGKFAHPETGKKLMGDKVYGFTDPNGDYIYKPVTQAIETESSKANKVKVYSSLLGYIAPIQNPKIANLVNLLLTRIFQAYGDEMEEFADALLEENGQPLQPTGNQGMPAEMAMSNQNAVAMSPQEIRARGAMSGTV